MPVLAPSRAPPGGKSEGISGRSHLDNGLQPLSLTSYPHSPSQTSTTHQSSCPLTPLRLVTFPSAVTTLRQSTLSWLILILPLPPVRAGHFKKAFPLFHPSTDYQSPHLVNFISQVSPESTWCSSVSTLTQLVTDPPHSALSVLEVFAQVVHLDWTGPNVNNIPSQDGEAFHDP